MVNMLKGILKEHVIRPALRAVMNSDLVKDAITETLAEEEFAGFADRVQEQVTAGVNEALGA